MKAFDRIVSSTAAVNASWDSGGGASANTIASWICENAPIARPTSAPTLASSLSRSSQSFSFTNAMPLFWPEPAKLKPCTENTDSMCSASFC